MLQKVDLVFWKRNTNFELSLGEVVGFSLGFEEFMLV